MPDTSSPPTARERAEKLLDDLANEHMLDAEITVLAAALTAAEQRGREAERERCAQAIEKYVSYARPTRNAGGPAYAAIIRALKEPTDAAFRAECIETMARVIWETWSNSDQAAPDVRGLSWGALLAGAADRMKAGIRLSALGRAEAEAALSALSTVEETHGLKLLGREPGSGRFEQSFNYMFDAAVSLLDEKTGK